MSERDMLSTGIQQSESLFTFFGKNAIEIKITPKGLAQNTLALLGKKKTIKHKT